MAKTKNAAYRRQLTEGLVTGLMELFADERKKNGILFADELALSVLASLTLNLVLRSLKFPHTNKQVTTDAQTADAMEESFESMRLSIESAIGTAFGAAIAELNQDGIIPPWTCEVEPYIAAPKETLN